MPKLEYESDSDHDVDNALPVVEEQLLTKSNEKVTKEKKPRSQKQIDTTNKMREALKQRREHDLRIKEQVRLEQEEMNKKIKKQIHKSKVKDEVKKQLKKIADYESESDGSTSSEEDNIKPKHKKDNGKQKTVYQCPPKTFPEEQPKQYAPPPSQYQVPRTRITFY